ncbi:MAG: orotidine-5'-phosphate decarboxylase [Bacteroidales bacterium]|jgi:orotidine-5'-phosphate decarboxylase|nr:orotidine-5'-phosphate decarboxylase [Bacteroidales bacterium]
MNRTQLIETINKKKSFLCVGLDTDLQKIPPHLLDCDDPVFEFNKAIVDVTLPYTLAYKPNLAFYETQGWKGLRSLERTLAYIREKQTDIFLIADAKRGDIGNTSTQYARSFFAQENPNHNFDAVTVAPYMGEDSVKPFLTFENKWIILLALTSNRGSADFQMLQYNRQYLFETVLETSKQWGNTSNMMYVVGATKADMLINIRRIVPNHFLLIPGVGAQGGNLSEVVRYGMNNDCGLIVNASRSIIYASQGEDFAQKAAEEARILQQEMEKYLS